MTVKSSVILTPASIEHNGARILSTTTDRDRERELRRAVRVLSHKLSWTNVGWKSETRIMQYKNRVKWERTGLS